MARVELHEHAIPITEAGDVVLIVEMRGQDTVPGVNGWYWEPMRSWLAVDGQRYDTDAELHALIERCWVEMPGLLAAVKRWEGKTP